MKNLRKASLGLLLAMSFCTLTACGNSTAKENDGTSYNTEKNTDKNNTKNNTSTKRDDGVIEDTGEAIGDGMENLGEDIRNGAENLGENTNAAGERTHTETGTTR